MDENTFLRVKLTFGAQSKQAMLDKAMDTSLSSMKNLTKLVFKHFPEIEEMVERPPRIVGAFSRTHSLLVKCKDHTVGDYIILGSEEELAAMELLKYSSVDFRIEVIPIPSSATPIPAYRPPRTSAGRQFDTANVELYRKTVQRKYFQSGFPRNGRGSGFAHSSAILVSPHMSPSNSHTKEMDSAIADVQQPAWRACLSHDRLSAQLGHPNLRARNPDQLALSAMEADYNYWVKQNSLCSPVVIENLSGDNRSYPMLSTFVNQTNILPKTIVVFVKLLAREEIRTSLLRKYTDRIYGVLIGSPFMRQLSDHIQSHLGMIPNLEPEEIRPYLALAEELLSRTIEGWKEVPLTALKTVVSKLDESSAKDDLIAIVSRLDDHCERVQKTLTMSQTEQQHFQGESFRRISVVPAQEELAEFQGQLELPVNGPGIQYSRVSAYLETHFRLLRADYTDPLRRSINLYRSICKDGNVSSKDFDSCAMLNLRVYSGVRLAGIQCGYEGVEYILSFQVTASQRTAASWESSKKLMVGALLCISSDHFETFFFGVVSRRDETELANGRVRIHIIGDTDFKFREEFHKGLVSRDTYVMLESAASYFGANHHVLKTLQRPEMEHIPFTRYLVNLEPNISPPSYLEQRRGGDEYDFSCAFPDIREKLGRTSIQITQFEWPRDWTDSLDRAQQDALRQGLTKELALIQGPPGTGKTFLGMMLVKLLVTNLMQSPEQTWRTQNDEAGDLTGPIVVISYTNRALDQLLEGVLQNGETKLIRVGRQSKSEMLNKNNLHSILRQQRTDRRVDSSYHRLFNSGLRQKDQLESKMHKCIDELAVKVLTFSMLDRIATRKQRQSLFWIDQRHNRSSTKPVTLWLTEMDPLLAQKALAVDQEVDAADADDVYKSTTEKTCKGSMKVLSNSEVQEGQKWMEVQNLELPGEDPHLSIGQTCLEGQVQDRKPHHSATYPAEGGHIEETVRLTTDVWNLTLPQRKMLHEYWLEQKREHHLQELRMLIEKYEEVCNCVKEVEDQMKLSILRKANVVGMTSSAAARNFDLLKLLKPEIVIVEEAAEVLEGHIMASISPSIKHLILMGDHLKLRPTVAVDEFATKNKLDLSMLERLVGSGLEHVTLQEQRRMRPNISKLVRSLYPAMRDHESVGQYEDVAGMKSSVFFFDHKAEEDPESGNNSTEATLVVKLFLYLLQQGYKPENIAILAMYTGQLEEIRNLLEQTIHSDYFGKTIGAWSCEDPRLGAEEINLLSRVSGVDEYSGRECDIIILSLASSSNCVITKEDGGKLGCLNMPNRICVALTRAREGLFIFGNADLLAETSTLWKDVTTSMRNSGELGSQLELCCQNHPDIITKITSAEDFKQVKDGGCRLSCSAQLACGHECPRRCHPGSHDLIHCAKPCLKQHTDCCHSCSFPCHGSEDCPACKVVVMKKMPDCEHEQEMECSKDLNNSVWRRRSNRCNICVASNSAASRTFT